MNEEVKKQLILNSPYLIFVYLFDKLSQAYRILNVDISKKLNLLLNAVSTKDIDLSAEFILPTIYRLLVTVNVSP